MKIIKWTNDKNVYELNNQVEWLTLQDLYNMVENFIGDVVGHHVWIVDEYGVTLAGIIDYAYIDDHYQIVGIYGADVDGFFKEKDYGKTWMAYVD